ncbi:MAG TPA: hypothetical protein VKU00_19800, partial [Chthonomonadaceae bacterium]|nr:hypothetical protein [Chthonomonadaceae bacterium]
RLSNPWGAGVTARVFSGRTLLMDSREPVLAIETQSGGAYLVERADYPLTRAVRIKLSARRNEAPKTLDDHTLGLLREKPENPAL